MLVDTHVHVVSGNETQFPLQPRTITDEWYRDAPCSIERLLELMDDAGVDAGVPWYAMELLEGRTLRDVGNERWSRSGLMPSNKKSADRNDINYVDSFSGAMAQSRDAAFRVDLATRRRIVGAGRASGAAASSSMLRKASAPVLKSCHASIDGSPQESPAMIVARSPPTVVNAPARALASKQAARSGLGVALQSRAAVELITRSAPRKCRSRSDSAAAVPP